MRPRVDRLLLMKVPSVSVATKGEVFDVVRDPGTDDFTIYLDWYPFFAFFAAGIFMLNPGWS